MQESRKYSLKYKKSIRIRDMPSTLYIVASYRRFCCWVARALARTRIPLISVKAEVVLIVNPTVEMMSCAFLIASFTLIEETLVRVSVTLLRTVSATPIPDA